MNSESYLRENNLRLVIHKTLGFLTLNWQLFLKRQGFAAAFKDAGSSTPTVTFGSSAFLTFFDHLKRNATFRAGINLTFLHIMTVNAHLHQHQAWFVRWLDKVRLHKSFRLATLFRLSHEERCKVN